MTGARLFAIIVLLVFLLGLGGLLTSESVLRWSVARVDNALPRLELHGVSGRLLTGVAVERLRWTHADGFLLDAAGVSADWRALPALVGRLHISSLSIDTLSLQFPETDETAARARGRDRAVTHLPDVHVPLHLRIASLHIGRVELQQDGETIASLDRVRGVQLTVVQHSVAIGHLSADGEPLSFELAGGIQMRGNWPLVVTADWRLALPDVPEISAETRIGGSLRELDVSQRLDGEPGQVLLLGTLTDLFTAPAFDGTLRADEVRLATVAADWPDVIATTELALHGWIGGLDASGTLRLEIPDHPAFDARLRLDLGESSLTARELQIRVDGSDAVLDASGSFDWSGPQPAGRVLLEWQSLVLPALDDLRSDDGELELVADGGRYRARFDAQLGDDDDGRLRATASLDWPDTGAWPQGDVNADWQAIRHRDYRSALGEAGISGGIDDWRVTLTTAFVHADMPEVSASLQAVGDAHSANIAPWRLQSLGGDAHGEARVDWRERLQVRFTAMSEGLDPGTVLPGYDGDIRMTLEGALEVMESDEIAWNVRSLRADGILRDQPLSAQAAVSGQGATIGRVDLQAGAGDATLRITGAGMPRMDLHWTFEAPELSALIPGIHGSMTASGSFAGDPDAPDIGFKAEAGALRWNGIVLDRVDVSLDRRTDDMQLRSRAEMDDITATVTLAGAWREDVFDGSLQDASFTRGDETPWQLRTASRLVAGMRSVRLDDACFDQGDTGRSLCATGHWNAGRDAHAEASLANLPLEMLGRWLPLGFDYSGELNGDATIAWEHGSEPEIRGSLNATPGALLHTLHDEQVTLLAWNEAGARGEYTAGTLDTEFSLALVDGGNLHGEVHLPVVDTAAGDAGSRPMRARVRGEFSDFDLVPMFFPEIGSVSGRILIDLAANGTQSDPLFSGTLNIEDGSAYIPRLGVRLGDMGLDVDGSRETVRIHASASSGPGSFTLDGDFTVRDGRASGSGTLSGENFEAANIPEARVHVSPQVRISFDGHSVDLDGEVRVPLARLRPRDFSAAVTATPDQVIIDGPDRTAAEEDWLISARIRFVLGDNVTFEGFGLSGRITGSLVATDEPAQVTRASGELSIVDGRYRAWGQELEIERGRLLYTGGPITRPGLDIRAVRRPRHVVVGANVRGTLDSPDFTLFSEPPMQQSETLSWLILGQPLTQAGGSEQELLDRTTDELGLAGGGLLLGELTRRLGVDDVAIERGDSREQAALVIGRYLSPRLYVAYGIGLFDPGNTIRLRYHIDRHWSVEAESGPHDSGSDLLWSIER